MSADADVMLTQWLAVPGRAADEQFVHRVDAAVQAQERLDAASRKLRNRFATELVGGAAIILAFVVLARTGPVGPDGMEVVLFSPAMLGALLLGLWGMVSLPAGIAEPRG